MDYTNLYDFQEATGIIVPSDSAVLLGMQTKFQEIFGTDIDLSAETPVGRLIEAMAVMMKTTLGVTAQAANQFNVNLATGIYLDSIAQVYDLTRISGTKTRITIKVFFSQGNTDPIPAGSLIMDSDTGEIFSIDSTIQNLNQYDPDTGNLYGTGTATARNYGPIVVSDGAVNSIQTPVMGWTGVINISPTYTGTNVETDEAFRKRILDSRPIGTGFDSHLVSALNRIDGVDSTCVLENNTSESAVKQGIIIPPHSIYIGCECIETEDLTYTIASTIASTKPIGTGMVNSGVAKATLVEQQVSFGYGGTESTTIYFYRAAQTNVLVDLTYNLSNYTGADIVSDIRTTVQEYIGSVGVGGTIYGSMIANALINKLSIRVGDVWVQKSGSDVPADTTLVMDGYEVPLATNSDISMSTMS